MFARLTKLLRQSQSIKFLIRNLHATYISFLNQSGSFSTICFAFKGLEPCCLKMYTCCIGYSLYFFRKTISFKEHFSTFFLIRKSESNDRERAIYARNNKTFSEVLDSQKTSVCMSKNCLFVPACSNLKHIITFILMCSDVTCKKASIILSLSIKYLLKVHQPCKICHLITSFRIY